MEPYLLADLCGLSLMAVVFFALFSHSIGFQIFGNLKGIPLIIDAHCLLFRMPP